MEAHIKKLLENLAKSFEKDLEIVTKIYEFAKSKISEETGKKEPELSLKAYHATRAKLTELQGQTGKLINVIFYGKDPSKDTTSSLREEILKEFWNNPESRNKVIGEGKVMLLKVANGDPKKDFHKMYKPLVEVEEYVEVDGEKIPIKGRLWDPTKNEDPVLRDYRTHLDEEGESKNWNFSNELKPNWKTTLFGIGYFEDTPNIVKKIQVRFYGESADPRSGQFVVKHIKFMKGYKMKVVLNEHLSTEECYVLNAKTKPVLTDPGEDLDIIQMQISVNEMWKMQLKAKGKEPKDLVPIVDLADLKKWHEERRARKDESGEVIKTASGWDLTNWDEYCLIDQCTYLGKRQYKNNYEPAMIQHDSTGKQMTSMDYDENIDLEIPVPSDVILCVKTGRGTTKYDREAKATIQDSDDPDLRITICGIKATMSYDKIVFPKELLGDL